VIILKYASENQLQAMKLSEHGDVTSIKIDLQYRLITKMQNGANSV